MGKESSFRAKSQVKKSVEKVLSSMIVETKPLHKKQKRLAKQRSLREIQSSPSCERDCPPMSPLAEEFTIFNRQRERERLERERKEDEWEAELLRAMELSGSSSQSNSTPKLSGKIQDANPCSSTAAAAAAAADDKEAGGGEGAEVAGSLGHSADSKKSAWSQRRSITMPEGDKTWKKSPKP